MVDTDVFLLHVDKYEVGDSTPGCMSHRFIRAVFMQRWADPWSIGICIYARRLKVLRQWTWDQADPWSITLEVNPGSGMMDLGSVNAPPPLEHRQSGGGWSIERYYEEN